MKRMYAGRQGTVADTVFGFMSTTIREFLHFRQTNGKKLLQPPSSFNV